MLKELFESTFYITHPSKNGALVNIQEYSSIGEIHLCDSAACRNCLVCISHPEYRRNINIFSNTSVNYISVEQVFSYVSEDLGDSCDYLLADSNRASLLEMTCSESKYVDNERGKRMKARGQLLNTLIHLFENKNVRDFLSNKSSKYVIFSWKDSSPVKDTTDDVENNFRSFANITDEVYSIDNVQKFDFDFLFKEVRYPDVLQWDQLR